MHSITGNYADSFNKQTIPLTKLRISYAWPTSPLTYDATLMLNCMESTPSIVYLVSKCTVGVVISKKNINML